MVRRSTVDEGPPKVGRRFTAAPYTVACRYAMTTVQLASFDDFFWGPAAGGAVVFEWPSTWRGTIVAVRFRDPLPSWTPAGHPDVWFVSLALEILPPGIAALLRAAERARAELAAPVPKTPAA
jgi:hypothetical protein